MSKKNKAKKHSSRPAKPASNGSPAQAAGLAWYSPESYDRLLELSADRAERDPTYAQWLDSAESALVQLQIMGIPIQKVQLNVDHLAEWCRTHNQRIDRNACSTYVSYLLSTGKAQIVP
jgi:hypothetical protein